jgi:hypothetical protein
MFRMKVVWFLNFAVYKFCITFLAYFPKVGLCNLHAFCVSPFINFSMSEPVLWNLTCTLWQLSHLNRVLHKSAPSTNVSPCVSLFSLARQMIIILQDTKVKRILLIGTPYVYQDKWETYVPEDGRIWSKHVVMCVWRRDNNHSAIETVTRITSIWLKIKIK